VFPRARAWSLSSCTGSQPLSLSLFATLSARPAKHSANTHRVIHSSPRQTSPFVVATSVLANECVCVCGCVSLKRKHSARHDDNQGQWAFLCGPVFLFLLFPISARANNNLGTTHTLLESIGTGRFTEEPRETCHTFTLSLLAKLNGH
jgi:hypothetical protein